MTGIGGDCAEHNQQRQQQDSGPSRKRLVGESFKHIQRRTELGHIVHDRLLESGRPPLGRRRLFELKRRDQIGIDLVMEFHQQRHVLFGFTNGNERPRKLANRPDAAQNPRRQHETSQRNMQIERPIAPERRPEQPQHHGDRRAHRTAPADRRPGPAQAAQSRSKCGEFCCHLTSNYARFTSFLSTHSTISNPMTMPNMIQVLHSGRIWMLVSRSRGGVNSSAKRSTSVRS